METRWGLYWRTTDAEERPGFVVNGTLARQRDLETRHQAWDSVQITDPCPFASTSSKLIPDQLGSVQQQIR